MVIEENLCEDKMPQKKLSIGCTVKSALLRAQAESRVITGLSAAVKSLAKAPTSALFCFIAPPKAGDKATHMHEVLLQAYCFENGIYIIKVDSSEKLSRIVGSLVLESCALIQTNWDNTNQTEILSNLENKLIDYCEDNWDAPKQPVIQLPES